MVLLVMAMRRGGGRKVLLALVLTLVAGVMGCGAVSVTGSGDFLADRARVQSYDADRFGAQAAGLEPAQRYPFGVGPGQFGSVAPISAHSTYVRVFAEQGLPGILAFLALLVFTLGAAFANAFAGRDTYGIGSAALLGAWCGVLVNSFVIDTLHWRHLWGGGRPHLADGHGDASARPAFRSRLRRKRRNRRHKEGDMLKGTAALLASAFAFAGPAVMELDFVPEANAAGCTITGTAGADVLEATALSDVICGLGGADVIRGLGGNDLVRGGTGNDRIKGGLGDDRVYAGPGNDVVEGERGNDILRGELGRDRLLGGFGGDRVFGGGHRDGLFGGSARDLLYARDGNRDRVEGGPGRDCARADSSDDLRSVHERF